MTQENKDILLEDLCARLPYDVKVNCIDKVYNFNGIQYFNICILTDDNENNAFTTAGIKYIKPYLFPLENMTEEQRRYINDRWGVNEKFDFEIDPDWGKYFVDLGDVVDYINWLHENHFDYRGLIEKGLAIDCTNLNIY